MGSHGNGVDRDSISYGYNAWHVGWHDDANNWHIANADPVSRPLDTITDPAITIAFADRVGNSQSKGVENRYASWLGHWGYGVDAVRYPGSVNLMFVDGYGDMAANPIFPRWCRGLPTPYPIFGECWKGVRIGRRRGNPGD